MYSMKMKSHHDGHRKSTRVGFTRAPGLDSSLIGEYEGMQAKSIYFMYISVAR